MPDDIPYTAPKAIPKIEIGFVPPFPTTMPKNEIDALSIFNQAGDAYAKCIGELSNTAKQDDAIRGAKQP